MEKKTDKLTQECAQAKAAGLSYGQWKALQPRVEVITDPLKIPEDLKKCAFCGTLFERNNKKKYCGADCRLRAYNEARRQRSRKK
jgi:hypothetical protein